jgi:hypothetical protein
MENEENPEEEQPTFKKYRMLIIAGVVILIVTLVIASSAFMMRTSLTVTPDKKPISIKAGESYTIRWTSSKIDRVGIALFSNDKAVWIAKDLPARQGAYQWKTFIYQKPGNDFRVAVFEYPWKEGNAVSYLSQPIEIIGPKYSSCDDFSVQREWPYLANNYDGAKKVFITKAAWSGDLGGLEGADKKCADEAVKKNLSGKFIAFLGDDTVSAKERLAVKGVFIDADSVAELSEGTTCHRLIAETSEKLVEKFTLDGNVAKIELDPDFLKLFAKIWTGRLTSNLKKECLSVESVGTDSYTFTSSCQNWSQSKDRVYQGNVPDYVGLERCYNDAGKSVPANYVGAYASSVAASGQTGVSAKTCNSSNHLFCVEQ